MLFHCEGYINICYTLCDGIVTIHTQSFNVVVSEINAVYELLGPYSQKTLRLKAFPNPLI